MLLLNKQSLPLDDLQEFSLYHHDCDFTRETAWQMTKHKSGADGFCHCGD